MVAISSIYAMIMVAELCTNYFNYDILSSGNLIFKKFKSEGNKVK
jgi:hypothetical protein